MSLLKIAVADDYKDDLNIIKNYISDCLKDTCNNIDLFEDGETLLTEFEPNKYDIVFLDIYMRETTGIDVARKIFETDKNCKIIFITTSNSFATESYEVEASGYLIKPVDKAQIKKLLNKCLKDIKKSTKYVDFISGKYAYHIAFKDIIYIDNALRTVRIHLYNRIIELDEGFHKKTAPILEDDRFIECCRCVIVNMEHIVKIQKDDFLMDNSENVPIRKRNRKEIHKAYIKYKLGGCKHMKKLILLLMIFFTSKIDIYALENPFNETEKFNVTSSDTSIKTNFSDLDYNFENYIDTEVKILDIIDPKSTGYNFIRFIPVNTEIDNITAPKNIFVQIGAKKFLNCDIRWNSIDTIDTSILGRSTLKGEIVPPSGYKFNGGLAPFIEIPFFIYKDEMVPLLTAEYNIDEISDNVELIPFGESISNYLNINDNYLFHTEYGDYFYCSVDWEIPDSTNTIGEITIKGKYRLPVGIKAKNEKSVYRYKTFYAMKDDDIYLNYIYKDSNFIIVQWIKSIKDFNNIKVFFKENNDQWSEAFENIYNVFDDRFVIYISRLNLNSNYEFKLNYNKKDYGNIHITTDKNHIKSYFINGDKDGGDNKEQKLPVYNSSSKSGSRQKSKKIKYFNENAVNSSISQNVTEFEMEYTTETIKNMTNTDPLPIEEITPNKTVISGDKLIETEKIQGDYITFEKNGVALEVPSNFIKDYDIKENDSIAVGINKDKENINVEVEINNKSIKSIKGSKLRISNKTEEISKNNILIKNTSKDNRFSEFFIDDLGTYKTVFKEKKEINYFVFISLGTLILVAGAWFIKWLNTKK